MSGREPARRRLDELPEQGSNPLSGLEWLTAEDAEFLADAIERIARKAAIEAVAEQKGAERAYASAITDPNADPPPGPPPPYTIELDCRPLELVATCIEPPTDTATFDVLRSINGGATFESMLFATVSMSAGERQTQGAMFMWEIPITRTLADPGTADAYPMVLRTGDIIHLTVEGGTGIQALTMQLRVQRVHEHVRRGRARA
jgi:hypothetical protein